MIGRRRRAEKVNQAIEAYAGPAAETESSVEPLEDWADLYTGEGTDGSAVSYAEYDKSFVAKKDRERSVGDWKRDIWGGMGQWVENNAPGSEKEGLLAIEMPENNGVSGGVFVRWDTQGFTELFQYVVKKGEQDPETGAQALTVTNLKKLEVDSSTGFPAPKQSRVTMSLRGRVSAYDGKQLEETPRKQSYQRSFTTALREAADQYRTDNDPQLPKGTTRNLRELSTGGREMLLKRYAAPGESLKTLEAIAGHTVREGGEWSSYKDAMDELEFTDQAIAFRTPDSKRWGEYMAIFPPAEDGSRTAELMRLQGGVYHRFSLHIAPDGDTILTAGKKIDYDPGSGEGIGQLPEGTRVVASVRALMKQGDAYDDSTFDDEERTPDERFILAARQTIKDRKTQHAA